MVTKLRPKSLTKPNAIARLRAYGREHLRSFIFSLGKLYRQPFAATLTLLMIAIALALPTCLYVLLDNLQAVTYKWHDGGQITLFLEIDTGEKTVETLRRRFVDHTKIRNVEYVSAEAAMKDFRSRSEIGHLLEGLKENPLPSVFILTPVADARDTSSLNHLRSELRGLSGVEYVQIDMQWLQRLQAITGTVHRVVTIIGFLLAMSVLLVVGNSIRLDIENRREEIEVAKLIGATDRFICRPFLYGGMWYGLLGGVLALLLVLVVVLLVAQPVQTLVELYNSKFQLIFPGFSQSLGLVGLSVGLGLSGAWLAVRRHISKIEPK